MEKGKSDYYARKLKKYNPLFPEDYCDKSFTLPNIIVIVDDAVRRDIDVCSGAIGWRDSETGAEILYLYDEAVPDSGLQFIPAATCDAIYHVDNFDHHHFIRSDCIFSRAQEEQLAELKHIACCLGAKRYSIHMSEEFAQTQEKKSHIELKESIRLFKATEKSENSTPSATVTKLHALSSAELEGNNVPQKPELKWFAHNRAIKGLIEMRCSGNNAIKSETLEFSCSAYSALSQSAARAMDCTIAAFNGVKVTHFLENQVTREHHSTLVYHVEF